MVILQTSTLVVFSGPIKPTSPLVFYCVCVSIFIETSMTMFMPGIPVSSSVRRWSLWNRNLTWDLPASSLAPGRKNRNIRKSVHDLGLNSVPILDKASLLQSRL